MRGLRRLDLPLEGARIAELAMHGFQQRGLRRQRELPQLALVGVIRVADAARAREPLDERSQVLAQAGTSTRCSASV
jgi:hypothetical protein